MTSFLRFSRLLLPIILVMTSATGSEHGASDADPGGREHAPLLITDFTSSSASLDWYVLNDNVMGGRSEGGFDAEGGVLHFAGRTNTRGGGFSSIRSGVLALDLSRRDGIRVRVKGDGRRYTWRLTTGATLYGRPVAYWADFSTSSGAWQTIDIPFSSFVPRFRGAELDGPPLDTREITGMGLMIYDGQDGPFELLLDSVQAYAETTPFSLGELRWENRVLVVSAVSADDAALKSQLDMVETSREEFIERDLLLVTLLDDANSYAGSRRLTRDEVIRARAELGVDEAEFAVYLIGKDGGVKLSASDVVPMDDVYALIDSMPMRRREMREDAGSEP